MDVQDNHHFRQISAYQLPFLTASAAALGQLLTHFVIQNWLLYWASIYIPQISAPVPGRRSSGLPKLAHKLLNTFRISAFPGQSPRMSRPVGPGCGSGAIVS